MKIDFYYINTLQKIIKLVQECGAKEALISGGCVRDMLMERPIKDIDVFYSGPLTHDKVKATFVIDTEFTEDEKDDYEDSLVMAFKVPYPKVFHSALTDLPIQLIQVEDVSKLWDTGFACNLNQVAVNAGGLVISNEFLQDASLEILSFGEDVFEEYQSRLRAKYPEFT